MHRFLGGRSIHNWPIARSPNKIVAPLLIIAICKTITTLTFRIRKTFPADDDDDDRDGLV